MQNQKQYIIVGGVLVVLIGVIAYFMMSSGSAQKADEKGTVFEQPDKVIPTVDSSVKVMIEGNTEGVITVEGVPAGTTEIEYQLTYNKKKLVNGEGLQDGVFGRMKLEKNQNTAEEKITFGTCSSGVCRYHDIDGKVSGTFKFTGSYGQQILEKEFEL